MTDSLCRRSRQPATAAAPHNSRQGGVSLVEALIAIAIMAFGMLGLAGVQVSLRSSSDISNQRSEAVRIASERIEALRTYSTLDAPAAGGVSRESYDLIRSEDPTEVTPPDSNTTFTRTVTVVEQSSSTMAAYKDVAVTVSWNDRNNSDPAPSVTVAAKIAKVPPELHGALVASPEGALVRNPAARHVAIPRGAKTLGSLSVFKPPQPAGSATVAWVFNNITGLLKTCTVPASLSTAAIELTDLTAACRSTVASTFNHQLLSGYVRFASTAAAPDVAQAKNPTGTGWNLDLVVSLTSHIGSPQCYDDAPTSLAAASIPGITVTYYCAIPRRAAGTWSGRARVTPRGWAATSDIAAWTITRTAGPTNFVVCRYTTMATDAFVAGDGKANRDHPLDYSADVANKRTSPDQALVLQNFLVIKAGHTCPTHSPTADEAVNAHTRLHQDGTLLFANPPVATASSLPGAGGGDDGE